MTGLPSVSVVMPARDAAATVDRAVTSVMEQEYDGDLKLIVADGNSSDRTIAILAAAASQNPRVTVVPNPAATTPAGLNAAIAEASGDVIVRCDAHCVLPPGYIATAVGDLAETGADVVGGIQNPRGETLGQKATAAAMRSWLGSGGAAYRLADRAGPTDTVYLGIFKRSALDRVGGFDESLVRNQDYELNYRIRSTGGVVWLDPDLRVTYRPRATLRALWTQYFAYGRWKRRVLGMHPRSTRARQLIPPAFVVALAASAGLAIAGRTAAALVSPITYAAAIAVVSLATAIRDRDLSALLMPGALATMHIAWGAGFLIGPPAGTGQRRSAA